MDTKVVCDRLVSWIQDQVKGAQAQGCVVGLSGGIDSAVVAALCKRAFPAHTLGVIMSCHSNAQDARDAKTVVEKFGVSLQEVVLDDVYDLFLRVLDAPQSQSGRADLARANIKPRLRMTTLYHYANLHNYLVVGTGNKSELTVGYYTKYGDGGVDLLPIAGLVKGEVRELARYLDVPQAILDKAPSAGLWGGQTDEGEMGLTYAALDHYIKTGEAAADVKARIVSLNAASEHKRVMPPIPEL